MPSTENMRGKLLRLLARITTIGVVPTDTEEERAQKVVVTVGANLCVLIGSIVGIALALSGTFIAPLFVYLPVSVVATIIFAWRKSFPLYLGSLLAVCASGPFVAQWYMGGFTASGANSLWAMLTPIAAHMTNLKKQALFWQLYMIVCLIISVIVESTFPPPPPAMGPTASSYMAAFNFATVSAIGSYALFRMASLREKATFELTEEHKRSESLLLNILPASIADALKRSPSLIADRHEDATILFADIVGFTSLSASISPEELVTFLNDLFSEFDLAVGRRGLEKIKTIGDAYMVAGGVPLPCEDHALSVVALGLEILDIVARYAREHATDVTVRIGVSSGPVVAGVIGRRKFSYDLWGDTVNTASRMESHGVPGAVHISGSTYKFIKQKHECEELSPIHIKGKGVMTTYLLRSPRPK